YKEGEEQNPIDNVISLAVKKAIKEVEMEEGIMLDIWAPRHYGKSDHVPFHQNKIPSANLTIRGNKSLNGKMPKGYHKKEDVFDVKQFNLKDCKNYLEVVLRSVFLI
ncbi:MAG: M28 family peptidase, partial [Clostridia bacterium]|nr:M28 family peptidase [Clostridia bacterium]